MDGAFVLQILRNDCLTVALKGGKIILTPKSSITAKHRELLKKHKAELLLELGRWPNGVAPQRSMWSEPARRDELGRESIRRPRVILSPRRRR